MIECDVAMAGSDWLELSELAFVPYATLEFEDSLVVHVMVASPLGVAVAATPAMTGGVVSEV